MQQTQSAVFTALSFAARFLGKALIFVAGFAAGVGATDSPTTPELFMFWLSVAFILALIS